MKSALITGVTGQDGALLARFLLGKDYKVFGMARRTSAPTDWRLKELKLYDNSNFHVVSGDVTDICSIRNAIAKSSPDEIYNLAAQSYVAASWENPISTWNITGLGAVNVFEAARSISNKIKIYQASSSEMLGGELKTHPMNENEQFSPRSPYAAAKCAAHFAAKVNRESYGQFISCGILFNHESSLRGEEFVTRKVTKAAANIIKRNQERVQLGNLDSVRDWGNAEDFVHAMWLMLQQNTADDFIIATGITHSVRDLCRIAFERVGLEYTKYVDSTADNIRPADVKFLRGDFSKAKSLLNWSPTTPFLVMVNNMVDADLERIK